MKKQILIASFISLSFIANAQEQVLLSKKGERILPEKGDWAVAVDASPFLNFVGNVFSSSGKNSLFKSYADSNLTVMGKYFTKDNRAIRVKLNIGVTSKNEKFDTQKSGQTDPNVTVIDSWKNTKTSITLGAGIENRKGKNRLQGLYGVEAMFFYLEGQKEKYAYGNNFSKNDNNPAGHDFNGNILADGSRVTARKQGATYGIGARGFVGMEYFIFPKLSLGLEYGLLLNIGKQGDGQEVSEIWDKTNEEKKTQTKKISGNTVVNFNSGVRNGNGLIYASFHF